MSNQVYANTNAEKPYFGEVYTKDVVMTGNPGGVTGALSFRGWRNNLNSASFTVIATQANVVWGTAEQILSPIGAIPVGFRPTFSCTMPFMLVTTAVGNTAHVYEAYIQINTDGRFIIGKVFDGNVVQWSTNDQCGVGAVSYYTGPV